jgi:SAM-dependent methyltransferase
VPLRPNHEVIAAVKDQIAGLPGRTLLLGVTPELADIAPDVVAVDRNYSMVANIWAGNTASRRAVVGDWRNSNFVANAFTACVGDGSLCSLQYPNEFSATLAELARVLRRPGKLVIRVRVSPDTPETVADLVDAAMSGTLENFHAFKLRLAMALAAQRSASDICADSIFNAFDDRFSDRVALAQSTGWTRAQIDTIDFYRGSAATFSYPTQQQLLAVVSPVFPIVRLVCSGTYDLAERCPLLVAEIN